MSKGRLETPLCKNCAHDTLTPIERRFMEVYLCSCSNCGKEDFHSCAVVYDDEDDE